MTITPETDSVTRSLLAYNRGRDPALLERKFALLRADPFAFFRGSCHLFYATLTLDALLPAAPPALVCGDLHLENFGTYKGDNRLVYFDLNDFDEAIVAPCTLEIVRFVASLLVAAAHLKLDARDAEKLCSLFCARYRSAIADGKPRWIERATAGGMIKDLIDSLDGRKRKDMLDKRTRRAKSGRQLVIDQSHALEIEPADRRRIVALLQSYAATAADPGFFRVLDVARRIAGNGSLGLERYVLLVEGRGSPDDNYLLDLKLAIPSALAPGVKLRQPDWSSEAARVVAMQKVMQAIPPARLAAVADGQRSYILKELQPTADRLDLAGWHGHPDRLESVIAAMADITAWAQLRGCARFGAAPVDELQRYIAGERWESALLGSARDAAARTLAQWRAYCAAYDGGKFAHPQ